MTAVVGGALLSPGHGRVLTGGPLLRRGLRQLAIGVAAAAVTYVVVLWVVACSCCLVQ